MAFANADRMNEPDLDTQANLSPTDAATLWKDHIQPFAGKVKLVSPAVTNGVKTEKGADMGVPWLLDFVAACQGCTIDAYAVSLPFLFPQIGTLALTQNSYCSLASLVRRREVHLYPLHRSGPSYPLPDPVPPPQQHGLLHLLPDGCPRQATETHLAHRVHGDRNARRAKDLPRVCGPVAREARFHRTLCGIRCVHQFKLNFTLDELTKSGSMNVGDFDDNPIANFTKADGSLTDLGQTYASL